MSSPWSVPLWAAAELPENKKPSRAKRGYEPFAVAEEMRQVDSFLYETMLPLLGARIPIDARLQQRGAGDILEGEVKDLIVKAATDSGMSASAAKTKRSMEDVKITTGNATVYIDVKTRNIDLEFSMPNIVSIQRLDKFYKLGSNVFLLLGAEYQVIDGDIVVSEIRWHRAEEICWSCLSIHNLGKGQLQITDARKPIVKFAGSREDWMRRFHEEGARFYGNLAMSAMRSEIEWLEKLRQTDV